MQPIVEAARLAVRLTADDFRIVSAAKEQLGVRAVTEVLRMALRSLAREHNLVPSSTPHKPRKRPNRGKKGMALE